MSNPKTKSDARRAITQAKADAESCRERGANIAATVYDRKVGRLQGLLPSLPEVA